MNSLENSIEHKMDGMDIDGAKSGSGDAGENSGTGAGAGSDGSQESSWNLLALARQLVDQGKPSQALQALLAAMRSEGGDNAVLGILNRAREIYHKLLHENNATEELASLFAECVIAETPALRSNTLVQTNPSAMLDTNETSILSLTGRKQIMLDAFADGSSFICLQCGGLVSNMRKDEHLAYWCSPI